MAGLDPLDGLATLITEAREALPAAFAATHATLPTTPALQHRVAGLIMLADWVGSHERFFPIERPEEFSPLVAAEQAVREIGLDTTGCMVALRGADSSFAARFDLEPRPLQSAMGLLQVDDPATRLLILEAETGSGKTEAALARFFDLYAAGKVSSLYFALPTRVAAREIHERILRIVQHNFPDPGNRPVTVLAVPGYARVDGVPRDTFLPPTDSLWNDEEPSARVWAAERPKRFLAATVGVGTIDQALLSILQTKHCHLRSVCLDRSLLVVDEVHASYPYMTVLLEKLLTHHVGVGGHALLLSATLGERARSRLLRAAGAPGEPRDRSAAESCPYPALTDLTGRMRPTGSTTGRAKRVSFEIFPQQGHPEVVLPEVAAALGGGAKVLVVLNTVRRAVAFQRAVEDYPDIDHDHLFLCAGVVCPHHGRFARPDREILDRQVTESLRRDSGPGPLLLVGTQTLEQSLDIDADLLVTDLCPADVLLQRVGRLHRHERFRPQSYESPRCLVLTPPDDSAESLLDYRGNTVRMVGSWGLGTVYRDLRPIVLTWRFLKNQAELAIPQDNRRFVEAATHPHSLDSLTGPLWEEHGLKVEGQDRAEGVAAHYAAALYGAPFGAEPFNELDARNGTRLGLDDVVVPLGSPVTSPFGATITEIVVPGHMVGERAAQPDGAEATPKEGGFDFSYAGRNYQYTRYGLERGDA